MISRHRPRRRSPAAQAGFVLLALAAHVGLGYVLVSGLGHRVVEVLRQPLEARIIVEAPPPPVVEPPPPPRQVAAPLPPKRTPPPFVPKPEVKVGLPPAPAAIQAVSETRAEAPPAPQPIPEAPPAKAEAVRVLPSLDASRTCRPPQYPSVSRRNGESGAVTLKFLIDADGSVVDSAVDASSGFPRLDEAALAALSLCQFKPGTVDGRPEKSWARMRYVWKLN